MTFNAVHKAVEHVRSAGFQAVIISQGGDLFTHKEYGVRVTEAGFPDTVTELWDESDLDSFDREYAADNT